MVFIVPRQLGSLSESLVAAIHLATIWALLSMSVQMVFVILFLRKQLPTKLALVSQLREVD